MSRAGLAAALLCGLLSLCAHLPASWADVALARHSQGALRLSAAEGTVWNGRAVLVRLDGRGGVEPGAPVRWRLLPARLLQGALVWQVVCGGVEYRLRYPGGVWQEAEADGVGDRPPPRER